MTSSRSPVAFFVVMPVTYTTVPLGLVASDEAVAEMNGPPNRCSHTWVPPGTAVLRWLAGGRAVGGGPGDAAAGVETP